MSIIYYVHVVLYLGSHTCVKYIITRKVSLEWILRLESPVIGPLLTENWKALKQKLKNDKNVEDFLQMFPYLLET